MINQYFKNEYLLGINYIGYCDYLFSKAYRSLYYSIYNREKIIENESIAEIKFEGKPIIYQQFYPEPQIYDKKPENRHIVTIPEGITKWFIEEKDKELKSFIDLLENDSLNKKLINNILKQDLENGFIKMYERSIELFNKKYSIDELSDCLYNEYLISGILNSKQYSKLIATIKLLFIENIVLPISSIEGFSELINKIPLEKRKSNIINITNDLYFSANKKLHQALTSNSYHNFFTLLYKANNEFLQISYLIEITHNSLPYEFEYNEIINKCLATEMGITLICHLDLSKNWLDINEWVTFSEEINMHQRIEYIDSISCFENPILPIFLAQILKKSIIVKCTEDTSIIRDKINKIDNNVDDIFIRYNLDNIIKCGKARLKRS